MADHFSEEHPAPTPRYAAVAGILPADSYCPVRIHCIPEGLVVAYNPTVETRASVWGMLTELFGDLVDVTPAEALAVAA